MPFAYVIERLAKVGTLPVSLGHYRSAGIVPLGRILLPANLLDVVGVYAVRS